MAVAGVILIGLAVLILYEEIKGGFPASVASAASSSDTSQSSVPSAPTSTGSFSPSGSSGAIGDVQHNVTALANWAKSQGIDPRVALTILAGESQGQSVIGNPNDPYGGSFGPLQINGINRGLLPGGWPNWAYSIENDIQAITAGAGNWNILKGVSYNQFLQSPASYYASAQRGDYTTVAQNLAAANDFQGTVSGWCNQYGVC